LLSVPEIVTLKTGVGSAGAVLAVSAPCGHRVRPFAVDFDAPTSTFSTGVELDARRLIADGETVELTWRDLEVSRERILAGARWVAQLASGGERATYR
jgi:hypothetical protein